MRQYLKAKPHPWGTKCYMTCDSETDTATEPRYTRGEKPVIGETYCYQRMRCYVLYTVFYKGIGIDWPLQTVFTRVFSSPRCFSTVGSTTSGPFARIASALAPALSTRRKSQEDLGALIGLHTRVVSNMAAVMWMDNKPVYFLSKGCSTALTTVGRRSGTYIEQMAGP